MENKEKEEIIVDHQEELEVNGQDEGQIYPMNGIKVDKGFYSVFELKRRYDANQKRIILDSDFQRSDVWNRDRKAELVESVLMGLPLPIFYFNQDKYGRLIVVDGRQRLTALFDYMNNKYPLKHLKILSHLNDLKFDQLSPVLSSRLEDYQIQAHVIQPPTPDRIKFDIFDRVNRGGMQLNKQEIRNALYQGNATRLLNEIVLDSSFKEATGNAFAREKRMKDKYLITRILTFYLYNQKKILDDNSDPYVFKDDIDDFLGKGLECINNMSDADIQGVKNKIEETLHQSAVILGKDAFRLKKEGKKSPINMNVFETVMFALLYTPKLSKEKQIAFRDKLFAFIDSDDFRENIGNHRDVGQKLHWRLKQAEKIGGSMKE